MKTILSILVLITIKTTFAQTTVEFNLSDNCTDDRVKEYYISLTSFKENNKIYELDENVSTVQVEDGAYLITIAKPEGDHFKTYSFSREFLRDSTYTLKIEFPQIGQKYTNAIHDQKVLGFYNCDELCNGPQKDYYNNGTLRMEGEFKNGIPEGTIKRYSPEGKLIEIQFYDKNGTYRKSKYPNYEEYLKHN